MFESFQPTVTAFSTVLCRLIIVCNPNIQKVMPHNGNKFSGWLDGLRIPKQIWVKVEVEVMESSSVKPEMLSPYSKPI